MSIYTTYRFMKDKARKNSNGKLTSSEIIEHLLSSNAYDLPTLMEEYHLNFTDKITLFVEREELVEFINNVKFPSEAISLSVPYSSFIVNYQTGTKIDEVEMNSCLVASGTTADFTERFSTVFDKYNIKQSSSKHLASDDQKYIYIIWNDKDNASTYNTYSFQELIDVTSNFSNFQKYFENKKGNAPASKMKECYYHVRMITGILIYINCFEDAIRPGLPFNITGKRPIIRSGSTLTLQSSSEITKMHNGREAHYRSGHYRLLADKRFKAMRNKIILVNPAYIGSRIKPHTIQKPTE